ncbi:hypothetical protein BANRA_05502 [Escherichia coli]|uniref:Type-F conjugative transfer system pilin assembly thiol-disulfide isomerase TrbB n=1 Tax=Escherichia coli TaxID=562 RepID=A0A3P5HCE3_ECOLX|nr:hypothetical protein BANRA_05502 [Escherichia coli]
MSLTKLLPVILLMMATGVQASTRDEIERLWNPQGMAAQPAQPAAGTSAEKAGCWFRLSNGRQVNGRLEGGCLCRALPLLSPV